MKKLAAVFLTLCFSFKGVFGQSITPGGGGGGGGGGSGTVTSVATGCNATGGTITTTGTISIKTSSITLTTASPAISVAGSNCGGVIYLTNASADTPTIPGAGTTGYPDGWSTIVCNPTAFIKPLTPGAGTIGNAATYPLAAGSDAAPSCIGIQSGSNHGSADYGLHQVPGGGGGTASPTFTGTVTFPDASTATTAGFNNLVGIGLGVAAPASGAALASTAPISWNSDTFLNRGTAAGILALSDTTTATEFRVYNTVDTVTSPTNYERGVFGFNSVANVLTIGTQNGGTGAIRNLEFIVGGTNVADYGITVAGQWSINRGITMGASFSLILQTTGAVRVSPTGSLQLNSGGTLLTSGSNALLRLGSQTDVAAPVAQTIEVQNVIAGNANNNGANLTINGSKSNGSGGGDILLKTTLSSAGSGVQNTLATALTLKGGTQNVIFGALAVTNGYLVSALPAGTTGARAHVTDQLTTCAVPGAALTGGGGVVCPVFYNGSAWVGG